MTGDDFEVNDTGTMNLVEQQQKRIEELEAERDKWIKKAAAYTANWLNERDRNAKLEKVREAAQEYRDAELRGIVGLPSGVKALDKLGEAAARIEELEARLMLKTRRGKSHAALLERNAKLERVREAAEKFLYEQDQDDYGHSHACRNWAHLEHSQHQCGQCDTREALAACEDTASGRSDPARTGQEIDYETANARCNLCDGQMPCGCDTEDTFDYEADAEARNRVDMPGEIDRD